MAQTTFSGPIRAGTISNTTGTTLVITLQTLVKL
jgi:hypothetical protein